MATKKSTGNFSDLEMQAMRDRAKELKAEAKITNKREQGEKLVQQAIAEMPESDKAMAKKVHEIVSKVAPQLLPKTWYGFPAYTTADDKVVLFFKAAYKYNDRYATLGFNNDAKLDEGNMWPTSYALIKVTAEEEKRIAELVKKAVG